LHVTGVSDVSSSDLIGEIHERRLAEAAEGVEKDTGLRPATVLCDVTREEDVQRMFAFAIEHMGHVDVLMNNAGLGGHARIREMRSEERRVGRRWTES